eukprot:3824574-Amphidinium_carterae.1
MQRGRGLSPAIFVRAAASVAPSKMKRNKNSRIIEKSSICQLSPRPLGCSHSENKSFSKVQKLTHHQKFETSSAPQEWLHDSSHD